jgi:hypothetical protein
MERCRAVGVNLAQNRRYIGYSLFCHPEKTPLHCSMRTTYPDTQLANYSKSVQWLLVPTELLYPIRKADRFFILSSVRGKGFNK